MKILVTGGTGFLGSHLVPSLLNLGHEIRLVGRSLPPSSLGKVEFVQGDLRDSMVVAQAIQEVDVIYHLAGRVSFRPEEGRQMFELHVDATRELLRQVGALPKKPRFILASSSGTIAVSKDERIASEEDDYPLTVVGKWPYYLSKIYEEKLCLQFCKAQNIPLVVLNPSLLMGPGDERLSSTWTVAKFLSREIPAMPSGGLSFVDVRDAAQAFVAALSKGELYGRHLMGINMSLKEFFGRLERMTGVPAPRIRLPSQWNILGAHALEKWAQVRNTEAALSPMEVEIGEHFFYLDASKAQRELGFSQRDAHQTLFDTVQDLTSRMPRTSQPGTKGRLAKLLAGR